MSDTIEEKVNKLTLALIMLINSLRITKEIGTVKVTAEIPKRTLDAALAILTQGVNQ